MQSAVARLLDAELLQRPEDVVQRLRDLQWPGPRDEAWRYTSLDALSRLPFANVPPSALSAEDMAQLPLPRMDTCMLVLVDGVLDERLSCLDRLPAGLSVATPETSSDPDDAWLGLVAEVAPRALHVRIEGDLTQAVNVVHLSTAVEEASRLSASRLIVELAPGSQASLIEQFHSLGPARNLNLTAARLDLAEDSRLRHYRVQGLVASDHLLAWQRATLGRGSEHRCFSMDTGARLARHELVAELAGPEASSLQRGVYLANGRRHVDYHLLADHLSGDASSRQIFRGIVDDRGRAVFNGKVRVHPGADGTDAQQNNANLLLSEHGEVDTKPELEIYAEDVKCAHGATVGQLDDTQLFYLRSRGIGEEQARQMLIAGFVDALVAQISDEALRRHVLQALGHDHA